MNMVHNIAEFYKHILNVGKNSRLGEKKEYQNLMLRSRSTHLEIGWVDYHITPYLIKNKVKHLCGWQSDFRDDLVKTLESYCLFIKNLTMSYYCDSNIEDGEDGYYIDKHDVFYGNNYNDVVKKANNLIEMIKKYQNYDLIDLINNNYKLFPNITEASTTIPIAESWNEKLINDIIYISKLDKYRSHYYNKQ